MTVIKSEQWNIIVVEIIIVFSFSENEAYVCLMMRQRSENVLEFTIGTY